MEDLEDDEGRDTLSSKLAAGLQYCITGDFRREINILEEAAGKADRMLNGRQLLWLICQDHKRDPQDHKMQQWRAFYAIRIRNDNLRQFQQQWIVTLDRMEEKPSEALMFSRYEESIQRSSEIRTRYEYLQTIKNMNKQSITYQDLFDMVEQYLVEERRTRNKTEQNQPKPVAAPTFQNQRTGQPKQQQPQPRNQSRPPSQGRGKGEREATPLCVPRDVRHEFLVRVLPAREGRVVLDQVPEEDRLPLRVALADDLQS